MVSYALVDDFEGWGKGEEFLKSLTGRYGAKRILEIGSGANPTFKPSYVREKALSYVTSDISIEELEKADPAFEVMVLDLSKDKIPHDLIGTFDIVFSRMVAEHVKDGLAYHRNIHKLLRPGGISAHSFSTLWSLPFAANRLLPNWASNLALNLFSPRDRYQHEKFAAYYSWSRGPSDRMLREFKLLGFDVISYTGYFGHPYYTRIPLLDRLHRWKSKLLVHSPCPMLCSYATVVLRKEE